MTTIEERIWVWGRLPKSETLALAQASGLPGTHIRVLAARGQAIEMSKRSPAIGEFAELEAFCAARGLSFVRVTDAHGCAGPVTTVCDGGTGEIRTHRGYMQVDMSTAEVCALLLDLKGGGDEAIGRAIAELPTIPIPGKLEMV